MVCSSQTSRCPQPLQQRSHIFNTGTILFKNVPAQAKRVKLQSQSEESSKLNEKTANFTLLELLFSSDKLNLPGGIGNAEAKEEDFHTLL